MLHCMTRIYLPLLRSILELVRPYRQCSVDICNWTNECLFMQLWLDHHQHLSCWLLQDCGDIWCVSALTLLVLECRDNNCWAVFVVLVSAARLPHVDWGFWKPHENNNTSSCTLFETVVLPAQVNIHMRVLSPVLKIYMYTKDIRHATCHWQLWCMHRTPVVVLTNHYSLNFEWWNYH